MHPAATVTLKKRRQVVRVAQVWCLQHGVRNTMIRFDVVAVTWPSGHIEVIRNAFEAGK